MQLFALFLSSLIYNGTQGLCQRVNGGYIVNVAPLDKDRYLVPVLYQVRLAETLEEI